VNKTPDEVDKRDACVEKSLGCVQKRGACVAKTPLDVENGEGGGLAFAWTGRVDRWEAVSTVNAAHFLPLLISPF
jgi:altronate dehydratase